MVFGKFAMILECYDSHRQIGKEGQFAVVKAEE